MKKLVLALFLTLGLITSNFAQLSIAVMVDESNNVTYPPNGQLTITNTGGFLRITNASTNATVTVDNLTVRGSMSAPSPSFSGNLTVSGSLTVSNTSTFRGNTTFTNSTTNLSLTVDDIFVKDAIDVTNASIFRNNLTVGGTLTVTNTSSFLNNVTVTNASTNLALTVDALTVKGTLSGPAPSFSGNVSVGGTLTVTNTAAFNTNVSVSGNLTNLGNAIVGGTLTVTNTSTFRTNVIIDSAPTVTNHAVRKDYVDNIPLFLTYDATGIANETNSVGTFLETMAPAANYPNGKIAKVFVHKNDYTVTVTTNTGSFMTGYNVTFNTNTASFVTGITLTNNTTTATNVVRFTSTGTVVLTNTINTANTNLTYVTSVTDGETFANAITNFSASLTTNTSPAITNLTVSVTTNITRKLYQYTDSGASWGTPSVSTTGLQ